MLEQNKNSDQRRRDGRGERKANADVLAQTVPATLAKSSNLRTGDDPDGERRERENRNQGFGSCVIAGPRGAEDTADQHHVRSGPDGIEDRLEDQRSNIPDNRGDSAPGQILGNNAQRDRRRLLQQRQGAKTRKAINRQEKRRRAPSQARSKKDGDQLNQIRRYIENHHGREPMQSSLGFTIGFENGHAQEIGPHRDNDPSAQTCEKGNGLEKQEANGESKRDNDQPVAEVAVLLPAVSLVAGQKA